MSRLAALLTFIDGVRAIFAQPLNESARWTKIAGLLPSLLNDPDVIRRAADWPAIDKTVSDLFNLLFYEDPEIGFVINGAALAANALGIPHDHAPTWTAFGVVSGSQEMVHFRRQGPNHARLVEIHRFQVRAGFAEPVPPDLVHAENTGPETCAMLIVRSRKIGDFLQNMYHPETGDLVRRKGPRQVPCEL